MTPTINPQSKSKEVVLNIHVFFVSHLFFIIFFFDFFSNSCFSRSKIYFLGKNNLVLFWWKLIFFSSTIKIHGELLEEANSTADLLLNILTPLMHNIPERSTHFKSLASICCKPFKVLPLISGH